MATPLPLLNLGIKGQLTEVAREQLTVDYLWVSRNFRSFKGKVETSPGTAKFVTASALTGRPLLYLPWYRVGGNKHLNFCTDDKIYSSNEGGTTVTDISKVGGYTGAVDDLWDAISFKDLAIFTNKIDPVQKWDGIGANCADLGGTPPKAGCIFSLMTFVFLGNTNDTNGERMIKWSDNGFPETWTGGDSGFLVLYQSSGKVLRGLALGEVAAVYKSDAVHIVYYVGTPFQFGQRQVFNDGGIIGPRAVCDLGGIHIYWGHDNVYMFNGAERTGVADGIIKDLMDSVEPAYRNNIIAVPHFRDHEVYFGYTPVGETTNTMAWVYNWYTKAWHQDDLEMTAGCSYKKVSVGYTWDNIPGQWDELQGNWDSLGPQMGAYIILLGTADGYVTYTTDKTVDNLGVARDRVLETGLIQPGAELFNSTSARCTLEYLEVELENTGNHNLELWVGTQDQLQGDSGINWWVAPFLFPCNATKRKIRISKTARYFAFRIRTAGSEQPVRLSGITAFFTQRGDTQGKLY